MDNKVLKQKYIQKAKEIFKGNTFEGYSKWKKTHYKFIAPASVEYTFQWLWDSSFHSIVLSNFDTRWAKEEILNHLKAAWEDGFVPHIIFWGGRYLDLPHWAFIESKFNTRPRTSAITQPPVLALAVEEIFKKDPDKEFLKESLPKIAKFHRWLLENRDPDKDNLISIISPNESGMDELPVFQYTLGYLKENPAILHYTHRKVDLLNQFYGFNSKKILDKDYFNVEELLFNCVFIEANRSLARLFSELGEEDEVKFFKDLALRYENSLLEKCWDSEDKIFYSLYSKKDLKAKVKTIASLLPLFLEGLKGEQLEALVKHLVDPNEFWRPYPVPSVSADEPFYFPQDPPAYKVKLLWRGPTWINTNWFIVKGLRKHGYDNLADQIVEKMVEMIEERGFREYYNPETGEGYRRENFGWSTLILDLL